MSYNCWLKEFFAALQNHLPDGTCLKQAYFTNARLLEAELTMVPGAVIRLGELNRPSKIHCNSTTFSYFGPSEHELPTSGCSNRRICTIF